MPLELPTIKKPTCDIGERNCLFYGPPKSGKTTFASKFPAPLFMTCGTGEIPKHLETAWHLVKNLNEVREMYVLLDQAKQAGTLGFKTIIFDTVDGLLDMAYQEVVENDATKPKSINNALGGYGAGQKHAHSVIQTMFDGLNSLGLGVILISHAKEQPVTKNAVEFNKTMPTPGDSARSFITKWVDVIGYIDRNVDTQEPYVTFKGDMYTEAGARLIEGVKLPNVLPLDYEIVSAAFRGETSK